MERQHKIDELFEKLIKVVMKYDWITVIVNAIWKFIFPSSDGVRTDIVGFISVLAMWIAMYIIVITAEAYLLFPYLLYGYYKYKYPEEYRKWEGKTQIEWYGEKYFNKYIRGTEREKRVE